MIPIQVPTEQEDHAAEGRAGDQAASELAKGVERDWATTRSSTFTTATGGKPDR
jgi:hypothetical protein